MRKEIKAKLKTCIDSWMQEHSITWYAMQQKDALKKVGCPVSYGTIRKLATDESYDTMSISKQVDLLDFFGVDFYNIFGTIELIENGQEL